MKSAAVLIFISLLVVAKSDSGFGKCFTDSDCKVTNFKCYENVCKCQTYTRFVSYVDPSNTTANCITVYGSHCETNSECSNLPNGLCDKNKCVCGPGWHPNLEKVQCYEAKKLNATCMEDNECYQEVNKKNVLICRNNSICDCKDGFKNNGTHCEEKIDEPKKAAIEVVASNTVHGKGSATRMGVSLGCILLSIILIWKIY